MKTRELSGAALDWAVAKCEGFIKVSVWPDMIGVCKKHSFEDQLRWTPSTDWAQGGPIIEREKLDVFCSGNVWDASTGDRHPNVIKTGPTPLIAAMRCYVASRLGEEVDIPDELKEK